MPDIILIEQTKTGLDIQFACRLIDLQHQLEEFFKTQHLIFVSIISHKHSS